MAVVLRGGHTIGGGRPDQLSPKAEHPEVLIEGDLLAAIARDVSLVGDPVPAIRFAVALVCHQIAFVGEPFALVCPPLAQICSAVTLDGILLAQVGQSVSLVRIDLAARSGSLKGFGDAYPSACGSSPLSCLGPPDRPGGPLVQLGLTLLYRGDAPERRRPPTQSRKLAPELPNLLGLPGHVPPPHLDLSIDPTGSPVAIITPIAATEQSQVST